MSTQSGDAGFAGELAQLVHLDNPFPAIEPRLYSSHASGAFAR